MADKPTRYTFRIKEGGYAPDDPHYTVSVRPFVVDDQAERFARQLSAENGNCPVEIIRGDARWSVWSGYLPRRELNPAVEDD